MKKQARPNTIKTTIRLDKDIHQSVKKLVALTGESAEMFYEAAIAKVLLTPEAPTLEPVTEWGPILAQRFLECLPTPAVIKDSEARIVWCNFAYEDLFDRPRNHLIDRRVTELGLFEQESADRLARDVKAIQRSRASGAKDFWEPLTILSRRVVGLFRTHLFVFRPLKERTVFLGDVSFDWNQVLPGYSQTPKNNLIGRLEKSSVMDGLQRLFQPFLSTCPCAIAIKNEKTEMLWCNAEYEALSKKPLAEMMGKPTKEVLGLPERDPILQNEFNVLRNDVWMYAIETIPEGKPRTSLRFPIVGSANGQRFIGTISAEFRQENIASHNLRQQTRPKPKENAVSPKAT